MKLFRDKKGNVTLPLVGIVVAFIGFFIFLGIISVGQVLRVRTEMQGVIDIAATGALSYSVNTSRLWDENLSVSEGMVRNKFRELINIEANRRRNFLTDINVRRLNIVQTKERDLASETQNQGGTSDVQARDTNVYQNRDQVYLEAIVTAKYPVSNIIDTIGLAGIRFYDFLAGRTVEYTEFTNEQGQDLVILRTVARIIKR